MIFYHFSRSTIIPKHLSSKLEWQQLYNNFRILRCSTTNNNKRKKLNDISNTIEVLNSNDENLQQNTKKSSIHNIIGTYFNSSEATLLFHPQEDELVEDCLSRHIDIFDDILNNNIGTWSYLRSELVI